MDIGHGDPGGKEMDIQNEAPIEEIHCGQDLQVNSSFLQNNEDISTAFEGIPQGESLPGSAGLLEDRKSMSIVGKISERSFNLFPKLPIEIRLKIWRDAKESRIIEVWWTTQNLDSQAIIQPSGPHRRTVPNKGSASPPALLHVSRESRSEALESYSLIGARGDLSCQPYFDLQADTLFLRDQEAIYFHDLILNIRHLALELKWSPFGIYDWVRMFQELQPFPYLQKVTLAMHREWCNETITRVSGDKITHSPGQLRFLKLTEAPFYFQNVWRILQDVRLAVDSYKKNHPAWASLIVEVKVIDRGEMKCCRPVRHQQLSRSQLFSSEALLESS